MYDPNRQSKPSLCSFSPQTLCTYIPHSHTLRSIPIKSHHYLNQSHINQLIQTICHQLFYYSSCMQKANSKEEQVNVQNVLLDNIKKILVFNMDKYGLVMEQKLFYLVVSLLHSRHNQVYDLRQFLLQVHYILTSNLWQDPSQQIPLSLLMLLNGQFQQLLNYAKKQFADTQDITILQNLMDMLIYKIQQLECKQNNTQGSISQAHIQKIVTQVGKSNWLKLLITQIKKNELVIKAQIQKQSLVVSTSRKTTQIYSLFQTKHQVQLLLAVLCGDLQIIEQLAKGSWGIYLNLYINFVQPLTQTKKQSYQTVIRGYVQKYYTSSKRPSSKKSTQQQQQLFLLKLINTFSPSNRFSFHQIYQSSFNVFSPIFANLIGLLMIQYKLVDTFSIATNRDYHQDILLSLIDNCNKIGWTSLVYVIGFVQNGTVWFKDLQGKQAMWENLMFQYLPYEIQQHESSTQNNNNLQNQIKQIQQKLQDLNLVDLSTFTKTYLITLFTLHLSHSPLLTPTILQIFFLTLQMSDPPTANHCFHQMKTFISRYYRTEHFDYELLQCLQGIFQRKQAILSQKMQQKVERLFCLVYKIKAVYEMATIEGEGQGANEDQLKSIVVKQLIEYNKMFSSSKKKKPISLCIQLLRLSAYLHSRVENILNIGAQHIPQTMTPQTDKLNTQNDLQLNTVRQFEWNLHNYLSQWKSFSSTDSQQQLSEEALEELAYFDKYFY